MKRLIILLIPLFTLTGCYNYQEMNELGIITATEVDKKGEVYEITSQIVNPKNQTDTTSANQPAFVTYTAQGKTIHETYRNLIKKSSRKIYGTHMQLLIIRDTLAREDMEDILDFYFRNIEIRKEFYVLIDTTDQEKNDKLLEVLTPLTNLSSQNILNTLKSDSKYTSVSSLVSFNDLMDIYLDSHKELVLPTIYIQGNTDEAEKEENIESSSSNADLSLGNLAIFKDQKMLGVLTHSESMTVNLLKNEANEMLITFKCNESKYASGKIDIDKVKVDIDIDKLQVNIDIKGTADLTEYTCSDNLEDEGVFQEVSNKLNSYMVTMTSDDIKSINEKYNSDVYGFRNMIYKKDYKYYDKIKDNYYDEVFSNLKYNIKSNILLQSKGNLHGGIYDK